MGWYSQGMTQAPSSPHSAWRSKWRWVLVFWLLQALVTHVASALLMWEEGFPGSAGEAWDRIASEDLMAINAFLVGMVMLMQAVLLMPVHRPGLKAGSLGARLLHCGLCATTIAAGSWLLIWPVQGALEELGAPRGLYFTGQNPFSFTVPIATWIVTFALLWPRRGNGVPVLLSVSIAAMAAAMLVAALLGAATSAVDLILGKETDVTTIVMLSGGAIAWLAFTPLVLAFCRRQRPESALAKLAARLFLGTIIEAAAIIPLDVMVRKKFDCYCGQGTFWALTFCWGVGALALGPAVFLLPLSGRRKRWYGGLCDACDYDMSGCMDAERCPECGAGWKGKEAASDAPVTS